MSKITEDDRIIVSGRYLVYEKNPKQRFRMRGMAFPVSPRHTEMTNKNPMGWIEILKQLRQASTELNTLRLYRIHPDNVGSSKMMDVFYEAAAEYGFYLLLPLTSDEGDGVLNRDEDAPNCYTPPLYRYGINIINSVHQKHPNVLGGILGNEVLNSLQDWNAAPCLLAYARDLKLYAPTFPLIYTTQHDGITAEVNPAQTVKLLTDYLTCHSNEPNSTATIDILGVNIESWCSSLGTFEYNEDGTKGSYLDLYEKLHNMTTIPFIFSELGCGQNFFDRDNGLGTPLETGYEYLKAREWNQVHVVETDMVDEFSGYIAYAYDGPINFRMTSGGPWDGTHPLPFNRDMNNYLEALRNTSSSVDTVQLIVPRHYKGEMLHTRPPTCEAVSEFLHNCCNLDLVDVNDIPSYFVEPEPPMAAAVVSYEDETEFPTWSPQPQRQDAKIIESNPNPPITATAGDIYPFLIPILIAAVTLLYCIFHHYCRSKEQQQQSTTKEGTYEQARRYDPQKSYDTFA